MDTTNKDACMFTNQATLPTCKQLALLSGNNSTRKVMNPANFCLFNMRVWWTTVNCDVIVNLLSCMNFIACVRKLRELNRGIVLSRLEYDKRSNHTVLI